MASRTRELALAILIKAQDQASAVFGGVAAKVTALFTAISAFLGIKFLTSAIEDAGDFEKALDRVIAKTDDGAEHVADLKKAAEEIGPAYGMTATQAAAGLEVLGAAGLKAKAAIATLPTVLALAKAEDIDLERATQLVVAAITGMGQSFDSAAHAADVMVAASKASTGSATEMGDSMKYAAANARALGIDIDQLGALLAVLANNGIKGEQAGTGLRQTFAQLLSPSSALRQELLKLGDSSGDFNTALATLAAAGPRGQAAIAALDVEVATVVRNLLSGGIPTLQGLAGEFRNLSGTAQSTAATLQDNLPGAFQQLSTAWNSLKRYLVEPLIGPIKDQVLALTQSLRDAVSSGGLKGFQDALVAAFQKGAQSVREFVAQLDLAAVLKGIQDFAANTVSAFQAIGDIGGKTASAISAAWNGVLVITNAAASAFNSLTALIFQTVAAISQVGEKFGLVAAGVADEFRAMAKVADEAAVQFAGKSIEALDRTAVAVAKFSAVQDKAAISAKTAAEAQGKVAESLQAVSTAAQNAASTVTDLGKATEALKSSQQTASQATAASADELKKLKQAYEDLKATGTATPQQLAAALNAYMQAMKATKASAADMEKEVVAAYQRMGIASADTLKNLADQAVRDFGTIKSSGASIGIVNQAFEIMAEKALQAGAALGPVGEQIAIWKLKAVAATEEQQKALDDLIAKYQDSGQAAVAASNQQVAAADQAASAIENYAAKVESFSGAGVQAFQSTTAAIRDQASAINHVNDSQTRAIAGYNELTDAGKRWADELLQAAIAADAQQAGMMTFRDETGRTVQEIQALIQTETDAAQQIEELKAGFDAGSISASVLGGKLYELRTALSNPLTSAGEEAAATIRELQQELEKLRTGYQDAAAAASASYSAQVDAARAARDALQRIQPPTLTPTPDLSRPNPGAGSDNRLPIQPSTGQSPLPGRTVRVVFALPSGDLPITTDEMSAQRLLKALSSSKLRAS